MSEQPKRSNEPSEIHPHVLQNIEAILALQAQVERKLSRQQVMLERVVAVVGVPQTIWIILGSIAGWCALNLALPQEHAFDPPPFLILQGCVALASLLMTTMVLSVQNTQGRRADQRMHLDLQVNLLAEQKIAKLIGLVEELRHDLPIADRRDPLAQAMAEPVDPHSVASVLDRTLEGAGRKLDKPDD
jgi:uncharacterized membrane protein